MWPFNRGPRHSPTPHTAGEEGFGAALHIAFEKRFLPEAGALQYAYETLALPMYSPSGPSVVNKAEILAVGSPILYQTQAIGIESLAYNGYLSGQFTSEPLIDLSAAIESGLIVPGIDAGSFAANELPT